MDTQTDRIAMSNTRYGMLCMLSRVKTK